MSKMNFASYQSNTKSAVPYQHYMEPLRVSYNNRGEQALAHANAETVGVLVKGLQDMKDQYDSGKVMEANNEYNRLMTEGSMELMQKKQEQALNVVDDYDMLHQKTLEKVRKKYGQFINYGKAAQAFNIYTERDNNTRRANMLKYQMAETDAYHETQYNNQLMECQQFVLSGGCTDEAIETGYNRGVSLIADRYANYGNEKIREQERIFKGQLVESALSIAVKLEDYSRMGNLALKYANYLDPKTRISVLAMLGKRQKDAHESRQANDLWARYGENGTKEDYRNYFRNESDANMRFDHYDSLLGDEMPNGRNGCVEGFMRLTAPFFSFSAENKEEVNVGNVCRLAQNSDNVRLERYNGGEIPEGSGIIYFSEDDDISDFDNAEHITMADGNGGFYGNSSSAKDYEDEEGNTVRGNGCIVHSDNQEIGGYKIGYIIRMDEQTMKEMSDLEIEEKTDKAWARRNKHMEELRAARNTFIGHGSTEMQDLFNQDVRDKEAYAAIVSKYWAASGYDDEVRVKLETEMLSKTKALDRQAERDARQSAGGGSGKKNFFRLGQRRVIQIVVFHFMGSS